MKTHRATRIVISRLLLAVAGLLVFQQPNQSSRALKPSPPVTRPGPYGYLPLSFEANQGQTDAQVQFLAHGQGYALFLTAHEAVFTFRPPAAHGQRPTGS